MLDPALNVLLVGGTGFLGCHLAAALAGDGHRVLCPVRPGRDRAAATLARLGAEVSVVSPVEAARALGPGVVVDAAWDGVQAGQRGHRGQQRANLDRMAALLDSCQRVDAGDLSESLTWIGLGSQAEYGAVEGRVGEDQPARPADEYGLAKRAAYRMLEERLSGSTARLVWLRLFGIYGPGQPAGWLVSDAIQTLRAGRTMELTDGSQRLDYLYAADAAAACARVVGCVDARGVLNVGSGRSVAVRTVVETLHRLIGSVSLLRFGALAPRPGTPEMIEADIDRIRSLTGWTPTTPLAEGLAATVAATAPGRVDA